ILDYLRTLAERLDRVGPEPVHVPVLVLDTVPLAVGHICDRPLVGHHVVDLTAAERLAWFVEGRRKLDAADRWDHGHLSVVWVVDTTTCQRCVRHRGRALRRSGPRRRR